MLPEKSAPALALFDIDGTLIRRAGPQHRDAIVEAVRRATGLETNMNGVPMYGMLDPDIITAMLRNAGAPPRLIRQAMPEIITGAQSLYLRACPNLERKTCPGVRRLLARLQRKGVVLGLVTGNLTRIGWRKMDRAGLRGYFRFGAFGEMSRNRAGLARLAVRRALGEGWIARGTPVSLVGDAPADILAARANRLRSIAVCTGVVPACDLRTYSPDILLEDLRGLSLEMLL